VLGLAPDTAALRRVSLRSADRDVLRVRQRFERALARVDWAPPGLPRHAILLVRRLAAPAGVPGAAASSLAQRVTMELRRCASLARRPWLHADAGTAEAVLFADEAELVACLIRDGLRGGVSGHWWWRSILGSLGAEQWLRDRVLPRGEILVPALSLLAPRGEAVPWVARLQEADARVAIPAVAHAFALPAPASHAPFGTDGRPASRAGDDPLGEAGAIESAHEEAAAARLAATVPEMRSPTLGREQRRLLVHVLAAIRAPSWARTPQFAAALRALDRAEATGDGPSRATAGTTRARPPASRGTDVARARPAVEAVAWPAPPLRAASSADEVVGVAASPPRLPGGSVAAREAHARRPDDRRRLPRQRADVAAPSPQDAAVEDPSVRAGYASRAASASVADAPIERDVPPAPVALPAETAPDAIASAELVETRFGGVFYLLNAALAMGLYGDFTAPRARNLELSPWDWLALVGRAWFGDEFVSDPAWGTLADLAVRAPAEEPGRDAGLPEGWLERHLESLQARLALALDARQAGEIPAIVCRHRALIEVGASCVHVHLWLCELPLDLRIAGLDRDPGWIPAAGRSVAFHFT
jgi:hypothetical protein